MKKFLVKAPTAFRTLNYLEKSFDFDSNAEAVLPEEVVSSLPQGYTVIKEVTDSVEVKVEEPKKEENTVDLPTLDSDKTDEVKTTTEVSSKKKK